MDKKFKQLDKENARLRPGTHLVRKVGRKGQHGKPVISVVQVCNKVR